MQLSKQPLPKAVDKKVMGSLHQLIAEVHTPEEAGRLLQDLLSPTELQMVAKRLAIAVLLQKGWSYRKIKTKINVSSATIAAVQAAKSRPGFQLAVAKAKTDEWTEVWSGRVNAVMEKILPKHK